jgi:preprotein translocase subunit SecF
MTFFNTYWKQLTFVPVAVFFIAVIILVNNLLSTGFIISRDVELSGGKQISFEITPDKNVIPKIKEHFPYSKPRVAEGSITVLLVEIPFDADENDVINYVNDNFQVKGELNIREIGPSLGDVFWHQTQIAFLVALVSMSILVFILFRSFVPSALIIFAAIADITVTLAVLSILGVDFSLGILAALLMILGYSVDTDILLTNYLLKKEGLGAAVKTGLTMYFTTVLVLVSLYVFSGSFVLHQIALTLIIGLTFDVPVTWLTNAGFLRMWLEKESLGVK